MNLASTARSAFAHAVVAVAAALAAHAAHAQAPQRFTPDKPLRFDIGFKLDRRDFSRGTERRVVYHLSLGQAF